ncbi:ATP-binding protein [Rudaeicoccus suwonensis]|uniref:Anti-sigma regulatory factor (Ser/Thr protein kinase) n=1 Tax=Rudaeicoccus suwonensis TaxID=657409 RepID=A0A561E6N6_9MICO|nr:ATP-binding protein [Rudaeicoccus suwonensis]TWE11279.1 anti-sigma regulatory factor (Ser/Thr protein kinase) [Rudaeicoccus suwonensis]
MADKEAAEPWVRTVRLPWLTDAVPAARAEIVRDLIRGGLSEQVAQEAETVVAELVANAILHGRPMPDGSVRVHWRARPPRVEVEVTDGGSEKTPTPKPQSDWALSGRGLRIVRSLAYEWGVSNDDGHTTVWAALGGPSRRRV